MRQRNESLDSRRGNGTAAMIFMLNCYDIWSATSTDACECGGPEAEASEKSGDLCAVALS